MSTVIDTLIYDRTKADVDRVFTLKSKILTEGLNALSAEEFAEYMGGMKGAYNYTDLNRVAQAVAYIADRMIAIPEELKSYRERNQVADASVYRVPYDADSIEVNPKTDWNIENYPTRSEMESYLADLTTLRKQIKLPANAPAVPASMNNLTCSLANDIERLLAIIHDALLKEEAAIYSRIDRTVPHGHAGIMFCGE